MRKSDLKFVASLIEQANPLKLRNSDNTSRCFYSLRDAYYFVLEEIEKYSADIYIDVEYVISKLYNMSRHSEVHHVYLAYYKPLGIMDAEKLDPEYKNNKSFYRKFIRALHSYTNTSYDEGLFELAYIEFVTKRTQNTKIKTNEESKD